MSDPVEEELARQLAAVNKRMIVEAVKAGKMPVAVLDHIGHVENSIYNVDCEYCVNPTRRATS